MESYKLVKHSDGKIFFLENVEKSQENPNSFFLRDFILRALVSISISSWSLDIRFLILVSEKIPIFFNKVPLDSKNEFSRVEKNFNNDNELNKTLKEFREDIYKITHDLIAPFSSKKISYTKY